MFPIRDAFSERSSYRLVIIVHGALCIRVTAHLRCVLINMRCVRKLSARISFSKYDFSANRNTHATTQQYYIYVCLCLFIVLMKNQRSPRIYIYVR